MKLRFHAASEVGFVREQNEDAFLADARHSLFAVADGVGGMPGGEIASAAAVAALREALAGDAVAALRDLAELVARAHAAVCTAGRSFGREGIATTLTLAHLAAGTARLAHVGDSFALLVREGSCRPLTREHNVANEYRDLLGSSLYAGSRQFALTRTLGQSDKLVPDVFEQALAVDDRLILATDGLTDLLEPADIAAVCAESQEPPVCAGELIGRALRRGGHDNITVIVIAVDGL